MDPSPVGDLLAAAGPALLAAAVCGLAGLVVPAVVARLPEPEEPAADKVPYAVLAKRPWLRTGAAATAAAGGAVAGWGVGWSWALPVWLALVPVGVALAYVDWHTLLLPTWLVGRTYAVVLPLVLLAAAVTREADDLVRAGWGWLVAGGVFWLLWRIHPRGMGYGDVRLSGVLGLALGQLGWAELLVGVYAAFLLGGLLGGLLSALRVVERRGFPFGPFMLVGALVGVAAGPAVGGLVA